MKYTSLIFGAASLMGGILLSVVNIFIFGNVDPKFRDDLKIAFELDIYAIIVLSVIGVILFWIGKLAPISISVMSNRGGKLLITLGFLYTWFVYLVIEILGYFTDFESIRSIIVIWISLLSFPFVVGTLYNERTKCSSY